MKIVKTTYLAAALVLSICACSKDDYKQSSLPGGEQVALSLQDTTQIPPLGGEFTVAFTAGTDWKLTTGSDNWLNVKPSSGKAGTTILTMTPDLNPDWKVRQQTLEFTSTSADNSFGTKKFTMIQECPFIRLTDRNGKVWDNKGPKGKITVFEGSDTSSVVYSWKEGESRKYTIESNIDWKVELVDADSHFKKNGLNVNGKKLETKMSFNSLDTLNIQTKSQNIDTVKHKVKIRIVALNKMKSMAEIGPDILNQYELTVNQDSLVFLLNGSASTPALKELSCLTPEYETDGTDSTTVKVHSGVDWKIDPVNIPSWLDVHPLKGYANKDTTVIIKIKEANPEKTQRNIVNIQLKDEESGAHREVPITQAAYLFNLSGDMTYTFANEDNRERKVSLETKGPWEFVNVPDWIQITSIDKGTPYSIEENPSLDTERTGSATITYRAKGQNLNFTDNNDSFFVKSTYKHNYKDDGISVKQDKFIFDIHENKQQSGGSIDVTKVYNLDDMLSHDEDNHEIIATTSGEWVLTETKSWLDVPTSGEKAEKYSFYVKPNSVNTDTKNARTAVLTFVSQRHLDSLNKGVISELPKEAKVSINAKQGAYKFLSQSKQIINGERIDLDFSKKLAIPAYKSKLNQYEFTLETDPDDLDFSCPSFLDSKLQIGRYSVVYTLTMKNNLDTINNLYGIISFKGKSTTDKQTLVVSQDKFVFDLQDSIRQTDSPVSPLPMDLKFNLTKEAQWKAVHSDNWICCDKKGTSNGFVGFSFTPQKNPTTEPRSGYVIVSIDGTDFRKRIYFSQEPYEFDSTPINISTPFKELNNSLNPLSFTFDVTSSGPWHIVNVPDWVRIVPDNGNGNQANVQVSITENYTLTERKAPNITVKADVLDELGVTNPKLNKTISFSQKKYLWDVSSDGEMTFEPLDNDSKTIYVISSGKWSSSNDVPSWIHLNPNKGDGNMAGTRSPITVSIDDNPDEKPRTHSITIQVSNEKSICKTIDITQKQFVLNIDRNTVEMKSPIDQTDQYVDVTSSDDTSLNAESDNPSVAVAGIDGSRVKILPMKNVEKQPKTAKIKVRNNRCSFFREITFTQPAYVFEPKDSTTITLPADAISSKTLYFNCSGSWTASVASSDIDWLQINGKQEESGSGNGTISVSAKSATSQERSGKVTIINRDNTGLTPIEFSVKQLAN